MPRIQQMTLHGKTDAEIAMAIGGRLSSSDIRLVRHHLGVGSPGDLAGGDEIPFARGGRAGLRASGGRAVAYRVPGELTEANKATHQEVGYLASSPRGKQRCALCTKFITAAQGGPACKRVKDPIVAPGWCRRFVRNTAYADVK